MPGFGGAGWSSPVARQAHNLKVTGSNPVPATKPIAFRCRWGSWGAARHRGSILPLAGCLAAPPREAHNLRVSRWSDRSCESIACDTVQILSPQPTEIWNYMHLTITPGQKTWAFRKKNSHLPQKLLIRCGAISSDSIACCSCLMRCGSQVQRIAARHFRFQSCATVIGRRVTLSSKMNYEPLFIENRRGR
jgi:hypothetical protein